MNLYGVYKNHSTGKFAVGEIPVIKVTAKRFFVERNEAGGFSGMFDKTHDGFYTEAVTKEKAIQHKRDSLESQICVARAKMQRAIEELEQFNQDFPEMIPAVTP